MYVYTYIYFHTRKALFQRYYFFSGDNHGLKTPYLEAKVETECPRTFATCFKYPLDRIHKLNTFEESKLYFHL